MTDHALPAPLAPAAAPAPALEPAESSVRRDSLYTKAFTFRELSWSLALWIPALYLLFAVIEASSRLWRPIAVALYAAVLGITVLVMLGRISRSYPEDGRHDAEIGAASVVAYGIAIIVCFSQTSRHLSVLFGGFAATGTGYWHWMRFGCANLLEAVLFDIPDVYDWNLSEIHPSAFWSRSILFVFRTSLELMVVTAIIKEASVARRMWGVPTEKIQYPSFGSHLVRRTGHLLGAAMWGIPLIVSVAAVRNDGFSAESTWVFAGLVLPVALGAWLAWESLRALRIPGRWNRSFAILGIVLGLRLVHDHWSALSAFFAGA
jgi:hypothetical protein